MIQLARGTHDLLFEDHEKFQSIIEIARTQLHLYGFREISTPILEMYRLFQHTSGETSDIVSKEMFQIMAREGQKGDEQAIVLRPEGTAPVMRAILNHGLQQDLPLKLFYQGPMFRYDRPQKGRLRQFHQMGLEYVGEASPWADVESIACGAHYLKQLGLLDHVTLQLNTLGDVQSRKLHREQLIQYFQKYQKDLSPESQKRLDQNPLRILDSKIPQDQAIAENAPKIVDYLTSESQAFFQHVQKGLQQLDIRYTLDPCLVRGLDYYSHTAFEFVTPHLGAQSTVLAGGRYDGLSELLGGPTIPGVGWACGIERLILLKDALAPFQKPHSLKFAVVPMDPCYDQQALNLTHQLRDHGYRTQFFFGHQSLGKKLKKISKQGFQLTCILGETEVADKTITLKHLETGQQETISQDQLIQHLNQMPNQAIER